MVPFWKSLIVRLTRGTRRAGGLARNSTRLALEELEDRAVPSASPLDLTSPGAVGVINGTSFQQASPQPTGSGVIHSFLRVQGGPVEQGYNTDARPLQFDEKSSATFTRSLPLAEMPISFSGGVKYREFLLDINQSSSRSLLSLDQLRIYTANVGNLSGYDASTHQLAGHSAAFDLGDNWIKLDARLSSGSGSGDMLMRVPDSVFNGGAYVYLYCNFGQHFGANSGFEEWAVSDIASSVPAPAPANISGHVFDVSGGSIQFISVSLYSGQTLIATATTDVNGFYSFSGLTAGTYTLTETPPPGEIGAGAAGTIVGGNGLPDGTNLGQSIMNIVLQGGDTGINFDFTNMIPNT